VDERNPNAQPGPTAPAPPPVERGQGDRAIPQADPQRPEVREPDPGDPRPPGPAPKQGIGDEVTPPTRRSGESGPDDTAPEAATS